MASASRIVAALLGLVVAGCGKAHVKGLVTFEGRPVVEGALIVFFDADGGSGVYRAEVRHDGRYSLRGLPPGKKTVAAAAFRPYVPPMTGRFIPQSMLEFPDDAEGNHQPLQLQSGWNTFDLELKNPPGRIHEREDDPAKLEQLMQRQD
jgi:hypothetical protein